jgi:hypothetical protein
MTIPAFSDLDALINSGFGRCENVFYKHNSDLSKVLFFFNGAVTRKKKQLDAEGAIFQRWSWHKNFKHPVFVISDPVTTGDPSIPLGWYLRKIDGELWLLTRMKEIISLFEKRGCCPKIVTFGSSGGGFASLLMGQLGMADYVISINPQTNIDKFNIKEAIDSFYSLTENLEFDLSLKNLIDVGFDAVKPDLQINYLQNYSDTDHFRYHAIPYFESVFRQSKLKNYNLHIFNDQGLAHEPPRLAQIKDILGRDFRDLIVFFDGGES